MRYIAICLSLMTAISQLHGEPSDERSNNAGVEKSSDLTVLDCSNGDLTHLDVSAYTNLISLNCNNNALTNLDVSFYCYNNNLTNLDVSANTKLTKFWCGNNPIVEIIVADTNNLPATFLYDGNPIIREP